MMEEWVRHGLEGSNIRKGTGGEVNPTVCLLVNWVETGTLLQRPSQEGCRMAVVCVMLALGT